MIYQLPIFSSFRSGSLSRLDQAEAIYAAVEPLLHFRNCSFPNECKDSITLDAYVPEVEALGSKLDKVAQVGAKANRVYLKDLRRSFVLLAPMVEAAAWVRWLDLEKGLSLALQAENLVASAILTRSLAEEAIRGLAIRRSLRLLFHYEEGKKYDQQKLLQIGRAFTDWALPATTQLDAAEAARKSRQPKRNQENASIDDVRKRLNDYVHPNYGSNRIAHSPAESKVFEIIGEALHEIYERFTADCWLNCSKAVRATRQAKKANINPDEFVRSLSPRETSGLSQTLLNEGLATLRKENQEHWDLDIAIEAGFDFSPAETLVTGARFHQKTLELTHSAPGQTGLTSNKCMYFRRSANTLSTIRQKPMRLSFSPANQNLSPRGL